MADRDGRRASGPRRRRAKTFRLALAEPVAASRRPALRRAAHRARRLHRVALVLGRVGARRARTRSSSPSSGSTTARSRRSCTTRSWSATSSRCAARSAAGSCGTATRPRCSSAAARASCRSWRCCGSRAPPAASDLVRARRLGAHARTTSTTPTSSRARDDDRLHARGAAGVARARRAGSPPTTSRPRSCPTRPRYVCGSPRFADAATDLLIGLGLPAERIRVERFGPTG